MNRYQKIYTVLYLISLAALAIVYFWPNLSPSTYPIIGAIFIVDLLLVFVLAAIYKLRGT